VQYNPDTHIFLRPTKAKNATYWILSDLLLHSVATRITTQSLDTMQSVRIRRTYDGETYFLTEVADRDTRALVVYV
jgi:hypothetical protein